MYEELSHIVPRQLFRFYSMCYNYLVIQTNIQQDIEQAVQQLQRSGQWPPFDIPEFIIEAPQQDLHGDFASNIAMQLAPRVRKNPLEIANDLKGVLNGEYDQVQIAHPGFLNFFVSNEALSSEVKEVLQKGERYGCSNIGKQQKVMFEFISANPTGPLTLPNGRGGYLGDTLSSVYEHLGYNVVREYYINDRGRQIDILGESVARRYLQKHGLNVPFSEELYQGEYITDIAEKINIKDYKLNSMKKLEWVKDRIKEMALKAMLKEIERVVEEKMQIHFDNWQSEKALYESGLADMLLEQLKEKDLAYDKDGATWVRTTKFGDDKDRVAIKSGDAGAAYMNSDIALFYDRAFERKFRKVVVIIGADHHGYEKRWKAIPQFFDSETELGLIFVQLANLVKDGKEVRMSKRAGTFVTIEELIDEVGNDAVRFFFLMYSSDRHMTFDLNLAKEKSDKNPVFYVQYAHARMCSILREIEKVGKPGKLAYTVEHEAERSLVKKLIQFPQLLEQIHDNYEAHHLTTYATELARAFHHFYGHCRVIDNDKVDPARVALVQATKQVLQKTLQLMGVSAPEKM